MPRTAAGTKPDPVIEAGLAAQLADVDIKAVRREYLFGLPLRAITACIEDTRDWPAATLVFNVALITLPWAVLLHTLKCSSHMAGAIYLAVNYFLFLQRFMLTLHFTEHRRLWRRDWHLLDPLIPFILCPLFGVPPGLYRPHHIVMHHVEDNRQGWDISSSEPYQRDNFLQFLGYWLRFCVGAWFELPLYAARRRRASLCARTLAAESLFWALGSLLWRRCPVATLWTLVLPFLLSSFLLSFGNWSQHVFVDPDAPDSPHRSTYNCLACPDNCLTYNDGYHIMHHLNSRLHWSELPLQFVKTLKEHDDQDALVFHTLGFFDVGLAVFTGNLEHLAAHVVPCGPKQSQRSRQDWVALMKRRLRPVCRAQGDK